MGSNPLVVVVAAGYYEETVGTELGGPLIITGLFLSFDCEYFFLFVRLIHILWESFFRLLLLLFGPCPGCLFVFFSGESQTECVLTKHNSSFVLFTLNEAGADLTLANLSLTFTYYTQTDNYVLSAGGVSVAIAFRNCRMTMAAALSAIYGGEIDIRNMQAVLALDTCAVYITTTGTMYPFIRSTGAASMVVSASSFVNIHNAIGGGAHAGIFYFDLVCSLTLTHSVFVACSSTFQGGAGRAIVGNGGGSVQACAFWNTTATLFGGALGIQSASPATTVAISDTSFVHCATATSAGGALYLYGGEHATLTGCTFADCSSLMRGGALAADGVGGEGVRMDDCTFVGCVAPHGGAIALSSSKATVTGSVFINNTAQNEGV
jgi:hypothetical protein